MPDPVTPPADGGTPPVTPVAPAAGDAPPAGGTPPVGGDLNPDGTPKTPPVDVNGDKGGADEAPIQYEAFKLPEGVAIDTAAMEAFTPIAQAAKLDQATAQKFVDLYTARMQAQFDDNQKAWDDLTAGWEKSLAADPDIGGAKLDETRGKAKAVVDKFGTPALAEAIAHLGVDKHPEFNRLFARLSDELGDDVIVPPGGGGGPPKSRADRLFGGNVSNT